MHEPTPPARRVAALRYQAEQLLRDAAAWGYFVAILPPHPGGSSQIVCVPLAHRIPDHEQSRQPPQPGVVPQQS